MNIVQMRRGMGEGFTYPYDAKVEYLQSDGTQYINTGYYLNGSRNVIVCDIAGIPNKPWSVGARETHLKNAFCIMNGGLNGNAWTQYFINYNNEYTYPNGCKNDGSRITLYLSNEVSVDGTRIQNVDKVDFDVPNPLLLFRAKLNASVWNYPSMKIYDFKIYEDGTLVRHFIPVRIGSVGYMYEKVGKQLYGNETINPFTLGPDVN